jgi:hypothetical protein
MVFAAESGKSIGDKKNIKYLFKAIRALSGATPVPNLSLVIKKEI